MLSLYGCSGKTSDTEQEKTLPQKTENKSEKTNTEEPEKIKHEITEATDASGMTLFCETEFDFDSDGEDDKLRLFCSAEDGEDEDLLDDGASWLLTVTTNEGTYELFNGYIQLGKPEIEIGEFYNEEPEKAIILTQNTTAGKSITHYVFSNGAFYEELAYATDNFTTGGASIIESINR